MTEKINYATAILHGFEYLLENYRGNATGNHTMNYRMGNSPISVKPEFFMEGNKRIFAQYGYFPHQQ